MPPSTKKPMAPVATQAQTQTKTSTQTKVVALVVGFLALSLAAYGFGFIPGINMNKEEAYDLARQQPQELPQENPLVNGSPIATAQECQLACEQAYSECNSSPKIDQSTCKPAYLACVAMCPAAVVIETPPEQPPAPPIPGCMLAVSTYADFRQPTTLVADSDTWHALMSYNLSASGDAVTIHSLMLGTDQEPASFAEVAVAHDGVIVGRGILASRPRSTGTIILERDLTIPAGSSISLQLWARLAYVQSSTAVSGAIVGVARSGHLVNLGITSGDQGGDWDRAYVGSYDIEAQCATSRTPTYSAAPASGALPGQSFMVRKSKPVLAQLPLITTTFASGTQQDLYRFRAQPDAAGSIALKKLSWSYRYVADYRASINNLRLFRGSAEVASTSYRIVNTAGENLYIDSLTSRDMPTGQLTLIFEDEEIISSSGNIYSLRATPMGHVPGDVFTLTTTSNTVHPTGYLTAAGTASAMGGVLGPNIDEDEPADGTPEAASGFVWSDLSEIPHSSMVGGRAGGSRDWIAGFVEYPLQGQTLSR